MNYQSRPIQTNMALRLVICLLGCMQWKFTFSMTALISGDISEDITFLHKTFPVSPSIQAIIHVDVYDPNLSLTDQGHYRILGIYTTEDHVNIKKQCADIRYGQLGNKKLHPKSVQIIPPCKEMCSDYLMDVKLLLRIG